MKGRVKVKMEKEVKERSSSNSPASLPKPAEQAIRTQPERSRKLLSFASDLMILAKDESLPAGIKEDTYEQAVSQGKRELMMRPRAKSTMESLNISHKVAKVLKEAKLNKGLELYKIYKRKQRVNESGLGGCPRFLRNNLSATLQQLSFGDLVILANAAEEYLPSSVEQYTCKQRESGEMDSEGSSFGVSEELQRNRELMQQKGEAAPVKVAEEVKPNRDDPSDGLRKDKLFENMYVRRKRVKNKEQLEFTLVGVAAGTANLVEKLCSHKSSTFINVDAAEREEATAAAVSREAQSDSLYSAWERGYPKRKRSQLIRKLKKNLGEGREGKKQTCDQIDTCHIAGQKAETVEEEDVSDASNSSSCNLCSSFIFNVQWSNKRKRNCMKLERKQRATA